MANKKQSKKTASSKKNGAKKTWTNASVEAYVKKIINDLEIELYDEKDKYYELKVKFDRLSKTCTDLREKEKRVSKSLTEALEKVKDTSQLSQIRNSLEIEKIRQFAFKWKNHFENLANAYPEYGGENVRNMFEREIETLIDEIAESNNFTIVGNEIGLISRAKIVDVSRDEWFENEAKRISDGGGESFSKLDEKRFNNIITRIKSQMVHSDALGEKNESGFSIDEALNPKQSLGDILKDIM